MLAHPSTAATFGPNVPQRLHYIAQLYGEEIHVLAGRGIASIDDLRGKKIAVPLQDGNAEFSVNDLLQRLQIEAEVVPMAAADAIDEVRSGTLAALVMMGGKPLRFVAEPAEGRQPSAAAVAARRSLGRRLRTVRISLEPTIRR